MDKKTKIKEAVDSIVNGLAILSDIVQEAADEKKKDTEQNVTVTGAANMMGCTRPTVYKRAELGMIEECPNVGGVRLFKVASIERYLSVFGHNN